jgi:hypothetical protein
MCSLNQCSSLPRSSKYLLKRILHACFTNLTYISVLIYLSAEVAGDFRRVCLNPVNETPRSKSQAPEAGHEQGVWRLYSSGLNFPNKTSIYFFS